MSSAIKTPAFQAKAGNIQNEDNSSIYSAGAWSFKNASAVTGFHVDASGNVGIGTTNPYTYGTYKFLDIRGAGGGWLNMGTTGTSSFYIFTDGTNSGVVTQTNGYLGFSTNNTERMRIDTSGALLVGMTAAGSPISGTNGVTVKGNGQIYLQNDRLAGASMYSNVFNAGTNTVTNIQFARNNSYAGSIVTNSSGSTSLAATSDERLKEDIQLAGTGLEVLSAIKIRKFKWKSSQEITEFGVIAQELNEVFPSAVFVGKDTESGDMDIPWMVDMVKVVPVLVKAIQELSAKVDAQAAEIEALKAK